MWPEIMHVLNEHRHELILSGNEISQRLEDDGIDDNLFKLINLNLLRISDTKLETLPDDISKLINLQSLLLHTNKLQKIPTNFSSLTKLKMLDLSDNQLTEIPSDFSALSQLSSLNLSRNKLKIFPNLSQNVKITVLDLSHNELEEFPDICHNSLANLAEVRLNSNAITNIPAEINLLPALKVLDLSTNKINVIPGELSDCSKLKDLNLKENPVSDKRLLKLIDQCRTKQVLDYVRQHGPRQNGPGGQNAGKKGNKKAKPRDRKGSENTPSDATAALESPNNKDVTDMHKIIVSKIEDDSKTVKIRLADVVKQVRPFILACVVRNVEFTADSFKRFIQMQTKLHDSPLCEKRNTATIATHDLTKINGGLTYTARAPNELKLCPLNRPTPCTGAKLFEQLRTEAENLRKEKKRNTYSGVHRYLYLLEGKPVYPCLVDESDKVVSFPPITNSEDTKITLDTKSILIEVTSATGQEVCRRVLDAILLETLQSGVGGKTAEGTHNQLNVEKVKIVDFDGNLKGVYPSRADFKYDEKYCIHTILE